MLTKAICVLPPRRRVKFYWVQMVPKKTNNTTHTTTSNEPTMSNPSPNRPRNLFRNNTNSNIYETITPLPILVSSLRQLLFHIERTLLPYHPLKKYSHLHNTWTTHSNTWLTLLSMPNFNPPKTTQSSITPTSMLNINTSSVTFHSVSD